MNNLLKFIIIIVFFKIELFSQDFDLIDFKKSYNWKKFEIMKLNDSILKSNFPTLKENHYFDYHDVNSILEYRNSFHIVDFNDDKIFELVYNGWSGSEGEIISIYRLENNRIKLEQELAGRIVDIRKDTNNQSKIIVLDYACCAGYVEHLEEFVYNQITRKFEIINDYALMNLIKIPKLNINQKKFKVVKSKCNLRFSPKILKNLQDTSWFEPIDKQNIIAIFKYGDCGTAYSELKDSKGNIWWFVVMEYNPEGKNSILHGGNNDNDNFKPIGWVLQKDLE